MNNYVAFLRGINVGGHHKVPMADLRSGLEALGYKQVTTILNSGNVLFKADKIPDDLELAAYLDTTFGFPIPTLTRSFEDILEIYKRDPFKEVAFTKDIRLYLSFLRTNEKAPMPYPWTSPDGGYTILEQKDRTLFSVLDLSVSKTVKAMQVVEKTYGKDVTTRNWNTVGRIVKKAEALNWV